MAKNTGRGHRSIARERANLNPLTSMWTTPNTSSGKFMRQDVRPCRPCGGSHPTSPSRWRRLLHWAGWWP